MFPLFFFNILRRESNIFAHASLINQFRISYFRDFKLTIKRRKNFTNVITPSKLHYSLSDEPVNMLIFSRQQVPFFLISHKSISVACQMSARSAARFSCFCKNAARPFLITFATLWCELYNVPCFGKASHLYLHNTIYFYEPRLRPLSNLSC